MASGVRLVFDKQPMWTLDEALGIVRALNPLIRVCSYHLAIGGGVINTGLSHNDLDLYAIPFSEQNPHPDNLRALLEEHFGSAYPLGSTLEQASHHDKYPPDQAFRAGSYTFWPTHGRRIDVFVVG